MVVEVGGPQERGHHQGARPGDEPVERGRAAVRQPGPEQRDRGEDNHDHDADDHQGGRGQLADMDQAEYLLEPVPLRDPHHVVADQLGDDHAAVEGRRCGERERQHGHAEAKHDPGGVDGGAARRACGQRQDHHHRNDGPDLDGTGEPEQDAAGQQPPPATRDLVTVEHRQRTEHAEQHQPRFQEHGPGGQDAVRVDRQHPAGHQRGEEPAVPGEQACHRDGRRTGERGEHPRHGHAGDGSHALGDQGDGEHDQRDPRRLHHDEVVVGHRAVHQPDRAAEVRAVVVFADARRRAGKRTRRS